MTTKRKFISALFPSYGCEEVILNAEAMAIARKLCPENFGRSLVLSNFIVAVSEVFPPKSLIRVAVVGGYRNEPEVRALQYLGYSIDLELFGIEEEMTTLDLNLSREITPDSQESFHLVLCSQVWEHIWNHEVAIKNIVSLMSTGTYLWIGSPASNRAHGSPFYFSAGFTSEYFANNLSYVGLRIRSHGQIGTRRNYLATHTLPTWLSVSGHRFPPIFAFSEYELLYRTLYRIRYLLKTTHLMFTSTKLSADSKFVTESWIMANKI
jgi:hypothetical protein